VFVCLHSGSNLLNTVSNLGGPEWRHVLIVRSPSDSETVIEEHLLAVQCR
jgi:hypothetical protein